MISNCRITIPIRISKHQLQFKMIATLFHSGKEFRVDFFKPIDISMSFRAEERATRAWYIDPLKIEPVRLGDWVGEVKQGAGVNFMNISFNPHAHGTHTESLGHISKEKHSVNSCFKRYFFLAELITLLPTVEPNGDRVITAHQIRQSLDPASKPEALVIRTLGNGPGKLYTNYSNTNPPFLKKEAIEFMNSIGIEHLLIDMPSIDRESDEGKLEAHHAFWQFPEEPQYQKTITELIYVPNEVPDGTYLLNFQVAPFENDASPSRPVLYKIY